MEGTGDQETVRCEMNFTIGFCEVMIENSVDTCWLECLRQQSDNWGTCSGGMTGSGCNYLLECQDASLYDAVLFRTVNVLSSIWMIYVRSEIQFLYTSPRMPWAGVKLAMCWAVSPVSWALEAEATTGSGMSSNLR